MLKDHPGYPGIAGVPEARSVLSIQFTVDINRSLVANFAVANPHLTITHEPDDSRTIQWPVNLLPWIVQESPDLTPGSWQDSARPVSESGGNQEVSVLPEEGG